MSGSGLKKLSSTIYASVSVQKIMSGHACSPAVRDHQLVYLALGKIIFELITFTDDEKQEMDDIFDCFNDGNFD